MNFPHITIRDCLVALLFVLCAGVMIDQFAQTTDLRSDLRNQKEQLLKCDGVYVVVYADKTRAHDFAFKHCERDFAFPANQDFRPD
jgi:hypothetical protein